LRVARTLSIGEVAKRSDMSISTLHFYEAQGLIEASRTAGNQRRYRRDVLRRLAFIRAAQHVGISLQEIAGALKILPQARTPNKADWAKLSEQWRASLDERIARITRLRDRLSQCIGCGCLSLRHCQLYNRDDVLGHQHPGAHRL
jgi:MerR family transcriptional regulator, redox-sensitive transcriptional activator SoxR